MMTDHMAGLMKKPRLKPTRNNVKSWLLEILGKLGPQDEFIFFFAGHGQELDNQQYLLTCDANLDQPLMREDKQLNLKIVTEALEKCSAARVAVVVDACRKSARKDRSGPDEAPQTASFVRATRLTQGATQGSAQSGAKRVRVTLLSCVAGESSYEHPSIGHGFFSYYLLEGLRKAGPPGGKVTLSSLTAYLQERVPEAVVSKFGGARKKPSPILGDGSEETWELAMVPASASGPPQGALREIGKNAQG